MKATIENWSEIWIEISDAGIERTEYDSNGNASLIVTKSGKFYELPEGLMKDLKDRGMIEVRRGIRVEPERSTPTTGDR